MSTEPKQRALAVTQKQPTERQQLVVRERQLTGHQLAKQERERHRPTVCTCTASFISFNIHVVAI